MMTMNSKNKNKNITGTTATIFFLIAIVLCSQLHTIKGDIIISWKEEQCLEKTGAIFEGADKDLLVARHDFASSMEMDMTSKQKMYAKYPEDKLKRYDDACTKYGGMLHTIKLDFFDCTMRGSTDDIELTVKNFANCMADVDECVDFGQEHLLQEAWEELGLHCDLEDEETKKDPSSSDKKSDSNSDIAKKEKEAAAKGADDVDKKEKTSEYVPKEGKSSSSSSKKKKHGFMKFVLFMSVCGVGYFIFDRRRRGLSVPYLPTWAGGTSSLPFGGVNTSRFQGRGSAQTGFVSNYNLLSADEEVNYNINNELQLSSNLTA
jgi:hypothetical protein